MKKFLILFSLLGILLSPSAWAQTEESNWYTQLQAMDASQLTLLIILGIVLLVIVVLLLLMVYLMTFMASTLRKEDPSFADEPTWWESFKERFVTGKLDEVGSKDEAGKMMADHSYDGITELDNFMPPWLRYVFIITIVFGVVYFVNYSVLGIGKTGVEEYEEELRLEAIAAEARQSTMLASIDETNVEEDRSPDAIAAGKGIFEANCAACHAQDGGGGVGPNLTDAYWIHGGSIKEVFSVIKYGVVAKGMVPWEDQLSPVEIQQVSSFILSLSGTTPANPKEPQGELVVPGQGETVTDSTAVVAML
ncbi:cbb3-type cytochrome c oxidase N-terminal domain-containing protein [Algoriphagus sp. CAU 1675]|uniref:cbb3-type cytochrome c oxidase N-terminal domain-containing protein n=1 Tax=Algoriphagus sp. CAU 1675 TaxID=3032597 RepID=UPI0023DA1CD2|nr:cbb3-type cytochrome c oxidase N-terminal domain-containing protein [Algoriphagus sp. CAU 1675]MDF2158632.1 cbb3-type cytochrome c oxidase N-terminal domain-containing protein [Algoriphagus sp. CAU 1675]